MSSRRTRSQKEPSTTEDSPEVPAVKTKRELAAEKRAEAKAAEQQRKSVRIALFEQQAAADDATKVAAAKVARQTTVKAKKKKLKREGAMADVTKIPSPARNVGTAAPEVCS